jgi:hypothetical protein
MDSRRTGWSLQDLDRGVVLAGAVLIGIGGLLGLVGKGYTPRRERTP